MAKRIIWSKLAKEDKSAILKYWLIRNKSNVYPIKLNGLFKEAVKCLAENLDLSASALRKAQTALSDLKVQLH